MSSQSLVRGASLRARVANRAGHPIPQYLYAIALSETQNHLRVRKVFNIASRRRGILPRSFTIRHQPRTPVAQTLTGGKVT